MDSYTAACLLGTETPQDNNLHLIELLKTHLSLDNNKLREDFVCSILGYAPSYGGKGHPDGHKPDGTCVDNKSGPNIIFPDGAVAISKKVDWVCLVHQFTEDGKLIYVAEVAVLDIMDELIESALKQKKKGGRVSPMVSPGVWLKKENTKVLYKNPNHYPITETGKKKKFYKELDKLPYHNAVVV